MLRSNSQGMQEWGRTCWVLEVLSLVAGRQKRWCRCSGLTTGGCLHALEQPLFFLQLQLFPARQSSKLPSCDAKHSYKILFREVILREQNL